MAIERPADRINRPLGGKLHTGRSRNDQVALDIGSICGINSVSSVAHLENFQRVLVAKGKANRTVAMPAIHIYSVPSRAVALIYWPMWK